MTFRVALTGGIGSGKSTVCHIFEQLGVQSIDTDQVAHSLTQAGGQAIDAIARTFGQQFIASDGAMDRAAMRAHVFSQPSARAQLEAILHPLIREKTDQLVAAAASKSPYVLVAIPLLAESLQKSTAQRHDRVLVVDCSVQEQRTRVAARSKGQGSPLAPAQIDAIIASQATREQRLAIADDVLSNRDFQPDLVQQIDSLNRLYHLLALQF